MKSGQDRKKKRDRYRWITGSGWASILSKDLSGVFLKLYGGQFPSKHTRRKIRAGRLLARNEGMLSLLAISSEKATDQSGTAYRPTGKPDESETGSARQMSEAVGPIQFYRSGEFGG